MELSEIIIQRIRAQGPLSFHDFMEMCLYYPGKGYYTSSGDKIGKNGDYYTSSNITSLFGAMIGKQASGSCFPHAAPSSATHTGRVGYKGVTIATTSGAAATRSRSRDMRSAPDSTPMPG